PLYPAWPERYFSTTAVPMTIIPLALHKIPKLEAVMPIASRLLAASTPLRRIGSTSRGASDPSTKGLSGPPIKPAGFDYVVAESVDAAVTALAAADSEAKILAGGQSLVPMLNFRLLRPSVLVDINRIAELAFIEEEVEAIAVGALTRHHRLETSPVIA